MASVVQPTRAESDISTELQNFRDAAIEAQLQGDVRPAFPTVLAVAKLAPRDRDTRYYTNDRRGPACLEVPRDAEGDGWRKLAGKWPDGGEAILIEQVQFITPLLAPPQPQTRQLREAAAMLHAPMLLVYAEQEDQWRAYNDSAALYWTIVGLFCVPGHTVGMYTTYHALLVDTQTGFILATAMGQSRRQENALPGTTDIVADRTRTESRAAAMAELQKDVRATIAGLALSRGIHAAPPR